MPVKLNNYTKSIGKKGNLDYFHWRVFIDEPEAQLREIESVQYTLHPTFPEPNQVRTDPYTNFVLETSGWGEFDILVTVRYKDSREEKSKYRLDLSKAWPDGE